MADGKTIFVTYYAEVPVKKTKGQSFAFAFLGVSAQYIGHILPTEIYVFVSTGNKIFLLCTRAIVDIPDIPECRKEWGKFDKKMADEFELHRSSELKTRRHLMTLFDMRINDLKPIIIVMAKMPKANGFSYH